MCDNHYTKYLSGKTLHSLATNQLVNKTVKWIDRWQVKLNTDKCKVISVHHRRYSNKGAVPKYFMNDTVLEEVVEIKDEMK